LRSQSAILATYCGYYLFVGATRDSAIHGRA
jgi:hypothetical protein